MLGWPRDRRGQLCDARGGTWARVLVTGALAAFLGAAGMLPASAPAQVGGVTPIPPKSDYFRFNARRVVVDTGEVVQFDLVRPCRAEYAKDFSGDSVWLPPGKISSTEYFTEVGQPPALRPLVQEDPA